MLKKIRSNGFRSILAIAIVIYVVSGFLETLVSESTDEFYGDITKKPEFYHGSVMDSGNFEYAIKDMKPQNITHFIDCLKADNKQYKGLGQSKHDEYVYIMLESKEFIYQLSFKWRKESTFAYITGHERRINKGSSEVVQASAIGSVGGKCFNDWLKEPQVKN